MLNGVCFPARALAALATVAATAAALPVSPATAAPSVRATQKGTLVHLVADGRGHHGSKEVAALQRSDGSLVTLDGSDQVVAASTDTTSTTTSGSGTAGAAAAYSSLAVVLVNFTDDTRRPDAVADMTSKLFTSDTSVNAYYQDSSDGRLGFTGQVFDYVTVSRSSTNSCDYGTWGNAAATAANAAGANLAGFDRVMYVWPNQAACSWAGMAAMPGKTSWINGYSSVANMAHELGHNLGEAHAQSVRCTQNGVNVIIPGSGATCTTTEYGDPFTVMGSGARLLAAPNRHHLGWASATTTSSGVAGTYTLAPADATTGTRLVRVPRGNGTYLSLEFRQPTGLFDTFASSDPAVSGVTLRIDPGTAGAKTQILDTVPGTATFDDAPLAAGRAVTDPLSGATISVTSVSATGATVSISYGGAAATNDVTAPSAVKTLAASTADAPAVSLSWGAATDDTGVAGYKVTRNGIALGSTTATGFTDTTAKSGSTYTYYVWAYDAASNAGAKSSVTVTVPASGGTGGTTTPPADTTAPTSVGSLTGTATSTPSVSLSWGAASDNVGVTGYRVWRNGTLLGTVTGTSYADSGVSAGTSYTYSVAAVDAAGNVGQASIVSVTVPAPAPTPRQDTTAPTAVTNLKATVNKKNGQVSVSWTASKDDVGVTSYTLTRSGLTKSMTGTSYNDKPGKGSWTYTVVARDAAGNTSAPVTVSVTV